MCSYRHTNVRFVPELGSKATQVEKELEVANQKAHAARWSHAKRKLGKEHKNAFKANSNRSLDNSKSRILLSETNGAQHAQNRSLKPRGKPSMSKNHSMTYSEQSLIEFMHGGNSDPFNTQGVPITPQINKLVTFIRDAYLPGIYITSYMKFKNSVPGAPHLTTIGDGFHVFGRRTVVKVWNSMKEEFSDEGRALSWCSSYIPVLAKFSSPSTARELNLLAIKMRSKSMKILKEKIGKLSLDTPPDISLISQVVSLFRAACKEGDIVAANIHAGIIQHLVDRIEVPDLHIRTLFMTCMNNDQEVAVAQMRNTCFDYENWIHGQIQKFWAETLHNNMPPLPAEYEALHKSIRMQATRQAAIRLRQYLYYRSTTVNLDDAQDLDRTDAVFTNFTTFSQYDAGVLINVYINLEGGKVYTMKESLRTINAALALTTLHVLRRGIFEATVYGHDHRSSDHMTIVDHLEGTMRRVMHSASAEELHEYRGALLWVCFYGARFEWRVNQKIKGTARPRTWFSETFARQAKILELTEWTEAREILRQFVLYEFLEPYLPMWFKDTMRRHDPSFEQG